MSFLCIEVAQEEKGFSFAEANQNAENENLKIAVTDGLADGYIRNDENDD